MAKHPYTPDQKVNREHRRLIEVIRDNDLDDLSDEDLALVIDSETNLTEALEELAMRTIEIEAEVIPGIKNHLALISERKSVMEKRAGTYRALILSVMEKIGQTKLTGTLATLSARDTQRNLMIDNEEEIPTKYWVAQDPKLDRKTLLADVKEAVKKAKQSPAHRLTMVAGALRSE